MKVFDRLVAGTLFVVAGIVLMNIERLDSHKAYAQVSTTPATVMAGKGDPITLGMPCGVGNASATTASFFTNRNIGANQNGTWRCVMNADDATYSWLAPYVVPAATILGSTASIGGGALLLGGSVSGTATVTGATQGSNCVATRADGTLLAVGMIIDCAVTAANTATVRVSAVIAGVPTAGVYNVRVIN
jgi:hypothetical protein